MTISLKVTLHNEFGEYCDDIINFGEDFTDGAIENKIKGLIEDVKRDFPEARGERDEDFSEMIKDMTPQEQNDLKWRYN
jgi:hypothetical protein